jgi:NAD-dependent SIR2 family protein deacetylase
VIQPAPPSVAPDDPLGRQVDALREVLGGRRLVALTGAGCSTESGIPDYRGAGRSPTRSPIQHDAFLRRPEVRRRYWARATLGWVRFHGARPNAAHEALAALEQAGPLAGIITQNVDRLHAAAGSRQVIELHGALEDVRCLACGRIEPRAGVHHRLLAENPDWLARVSGDIRPDGDADLPEEMIAELRVVDCRACAGVLKPDVVFFGGNVPETTLATAWALFEQAEALLVVGSSLTVWSGYRFVRRACERGVPVAIVNLGPTRADREAALRVSARAGDLLPALVRALLRTPVTSTAPRHR